MCLSSESSFLSADHPQTTCRRSSRIRGRKAPASRPRRSPRSEQASLPNQSFADDFNRFRRRSRVRNAQRQTGALQSRAAPRDPYTDRELALVDAVATLLHIVEISMSRTLGVVSTGSVTCDGATVATRMNSLCDTLRELDQTRKTAHDLRRQNTARIRQHRFVRQLGCPPAGLTVFSTSS